MPTIITRPKVEIAPDILQKLQEQVQEAGQVIVHCVSKDTFGWGMRIRIWPTTFLYDHHSDHQSHLIHVDNIVLAPQWQYLPPSVPLYYSLIFSGLPKSCSRFDLVEKGEGTHLFSALNIDRNETDVYYVRLR